MIASLPLFGSPAEFGVNEFIVLGTLLFILAFAAVCFTMAARDARRSGRGGQ